MVRTLNLALRNDLSELGRVAHLIDGFAKAHHLPAKLVFDCTLALDEALTNVISYGFPQGGSHEISVRVDVTDDSLRIAVEDDGVAFNPLEVAPPDLDAACEERPIGGLGMHFVRTLMSELAYRREGDRNVLLMVRRIDGALQEGTGGEMDISESREKDIVILTVSGRVDANNAGMLESRLLGVIEAGNARLLVDGTGLDYISSAGLRALLMAAKRVKANKGIVALCSLKPQVREILEIAGFATVLPMFPNRAAALQAM